MKIQLAVSGLLSLVIAAHATGQANSEECAADGDIQFLCGPVSPEDLVQLPDTDWIVAAGMEDAGYLYFVNSATLDSTSVYPAANANHHWDRARYGACPGPAPEGFQPHGLHLVPGSNGSHLLLVVRHGTREAVEVFTIEAAGATPTIAWIGCVIAPEAVVFNSVAATPEGGMVATHFQLPAGAVYEWNPGGDWELVPGSETAGPNGIEISADGAWLYIGGWGTRSLIKLSRGQQPITVESVEVSHHIDNVRWAQDGSLLAAGHVGPEPTSIFTCLGQQQCDGVSTRVTRVDVSNLSAQQIIDYPSTPLFLLGTVAIEVGAEIWVGGIAGSNRIARFENR